mmetsp:Transcript_15717/g.43446  ORF Transcript_15717/g.43446 Transcript_15717/m.43446 type:complete len:96 (-) Transcript_15717:66-353(-)
MRSAVPSSGPGHDISVWLGANASPSGKLPIMLKLQRPTPGVIFGGKAVYWTQQQNFWLFCKQPRGPLHSVVNVLLKQHMNLSWATTKGVMDVVQA